MKKVLFLSLAFMFVSLSTYAQRKAKMVKFRSKFKMENLVAKYNRANNTAILDLRKARNGRNLVCTDLRTGDKLYLVAKRKARKVFIRGMMIKTKSGRWIKVVNPKTTKGKPGGFGCPDGWDQKVICYTHPIFKETICYTRCTPTSLTLKLPPSF